MLLWQRFGYSTASVAGCSHRRGGWKENINMGGVCLGRHRDKRLSNRAWAWSFASLQSEMEAADSPGARPF